MRTCVYQTRNNYKFREMQHSLLSSIRNNKLLYYKQKNVENLKQKECDRKLKQ